MDLVPNSIWYSLAGQFQEIRYMKICLIEDDDYKIDDLEGALREINSAYVVNVVKTYRDAAHALKEEWDLVLLDMQLPLFENDSRGKVYSFAGERLLRQLERSERSMSVIVITQYTTFSELLDEVDFDNLVKRLEEYCPTVFRGAIQYAYGEVGWRIELEKVLNYLNK